MTYGRSGTVEVMKARAKWQVRRGSRHKRPGRLCGGMGRQNRGMRSKQSRLRDDADDTLQGAGVKGVDADGE